MRLRQVSLFIACSSLAAIAAMLAPPEHLEAIKQRADWKKIASLVMSPAMAGDIEDRVSFFLTQHQDKVKRATVQRAPVTYGQTASLSFSVSGLEKSSGRLGKAGQMKRSANGSLLSPLDDTPTPRQYPVASIYDDQTLRYGDYVVMPSGVKIFKGRIKASHRARDFVPVRMSQVPRRERAIIARAGGHGSMIVIIARPKPAQQLAANPIMHRNEVAGSYQNVMLHRPRLAEQVTGPRLIHIN